jgi:predicted phosphodiesterase
LYGNTEALARLTQMVALEGDAARLVFNGDFNWFNSDSENFVRINETVLQHTALRGNVETELASAGSGDGCGCGYPEWVSDEMVERSNRIMGILQNTARRFPTLTQRLQRLPMHLVAEVGAVRIAIVHGDAESLAGWSFSSEALASLNDGQLKKWFDEADVSLFACTHTCLPVVKRVARSNGVGFVVNNGSSGMPNVHGQLFGLVTRIATSPSPHTSYVGFRAHGLYVDLLKVEYDQDRWLQLFCRNWTNESPAYRSYFNRIAEGPAFVGPIVL